MPLTAPGSRLWLATCLALGLPATILGWVPLAQAPETWPAWAQTMALHPDAGWRQPPWTWWTTAWLHGSAAHLHQNLLALAMLTAIGGLSRMPPRACLALLLAWPLTQMGMTLHQQPLHTYIGLSGVLHAQAALLALHWQRSGEGRTLPKISGAVLLAGLLFKIIMENPWRHQLIASAGSDINVAPWAHLSGATVGIVLGLFTSVAALAPDVKGPARMPRTLD